MERSRVSGTLSLFHKVVQWYSSIRIWMIVATVLALLVTGFVGDRIGEKIEKRSPGTLMFYLRCELSLLNARIGLRQDWMMPAQLKLAMQQNDRELMEDISRIILWARERMKWAWIWGGITFVATLIIGSVIARREEHEQTSNIHNRGASAFTPRKLSKIMKKDRGIGTLMIGKVTIPFTLENLSFMFIGRPQQGKTQAILRILDDVRNRGDRSLIWCAKQEDFVTTHYDEQNDHIFCPGDARSIKWSLANDISSMADFDDIAARIIPETVADNKGPWNKGAREILAGLMKYWWLNTNRSNASLWDALNSTVEKMFARLTSTPECARAAGMLERGDSSTSHSFFVTLMVYVKPFELLAKNDGDFSIRRYLSEGTGSIFILSGNRMKKSLQPVQTLFIDLFMTHHLDLVQDRSRRIWYFLDELPALNKLPKLEELLNVGPSYGASVVIGTQSFDLIDAVYEETGRRAIFNACNTATIFSVADDRTAEELSTNIGKEEVSQPKQNYSLAVKDGKGSTSIRQEDKEILLYMPDQIKGLQAMNCIVRVLGYGVAETKLTLKIWPQRQQAFIPDERYSLRQYEEEFQKSLDKVDYVKQAIPPEKAVVYVGMPKRGNKASRKKIETALFEEVF